MANVLHVASLIGREFSYAVLKAALGHDTSDEQLRSVLNLLVTKRFLQKKGLADDESTLYVFRLTLIADVALQCAAFSVRKEYHQRIAAFLKAHLKPKDSAQAHGLIGHHLLAAECWAEGGKYTATAAGIYCENFIAPEGSFEPMTILAQLLCISTMLHFLTCLQLRPYTVV